MSEVRVCTDPLKYVEKLVASSKFRLEAKAVHHLLGIH